MASTARTDALLVRLADALGCPVETFGSGAASEPAALPTLELFRLWDAIAEPQSRQRVLAVARQEVQRQRDGACGPVDRLIQQTP